MNRQASKLLRVACILLACAAGVFAGHRLVAQATLPAQPVVITTDGLIDARTFGVVADGQHDDSPALQAAIDYAINTATCRGVQLPPGIIRLGSPLKIWPLTPGGQPSVVLCGVTHPAGFSDGSHQTVLRPDFANAPILSIQTGRGVVIEGIVFDGLLRRGWEPNYTDVFQLSNFAANGVRDSRYSPQCAIAFDPSGNGSVPGDGGFPGFDYSSRRNGSSNCIVRDCVIRNCIVGILADPNGVNSNTSELLFERLAIKACKVAYACGGTQAKVVTFRDPIITGVNTAFDTVNYGPGKGRPPKLVTGGSIGICAAIADYATDGGGTAFEGVSGESIGSLGTFGVAPSGAASVSSFSGCDLLFNVNPNGPTPDWLTLGQQLALRDSTLTTDHQLRAILSGNLRIDSVRWNPYGTISPAAMMWWSDPSKVSAN